MNQTSDTKTIFIFRNKSYTIIRGRSKNRTFETLIESIDETEIGRMKRRMKSIIRKDNKA